MKFKVGDRIIATEKCSYDFEETRTGTIVDISNEDYCWPYDVRFDDQNVFIDVAPCGEDEIELLS